MKTSLATLAVSLWCASFCVVAGAQSQIPAPNGWTTRTKAQSATTFTPPDLRAGEKYSVTIYEAAPLGDKTPGDYLRGFAGVVGTAPGQLSAPLQLKSAKGIETGTGVYVGPNGTGISAVFFGVPSRSGGHIHILRGLFSAQNGLFARYQSDLRTLLRAVAERTQGEDDQAPTIEAKRPVTGAASPPKPSGPLRAASLNGAKVFVKYYWGGYPLLLRRDHLLLFPDGTAFDAIPFKPVADFSIPTLRAALPPYDVGTWKNSGRNLILFFPSATQKQVTLSPHPQGWLDKERGPEMKGDYNVYYPTLPVSRAELVGAWKSETLGTSGSFGGATPLVAGGSSAAWNFRADGSFAGNFSSFFSSTTSNMDDSFKTGADASTSGQASKKSAGRFRLDGLLLTLEQNGERTVHLAFVLPHWGEGERDVSVDGDLWGKADSK